VRRFTRTEKIAIALAVAGIGAFVVSSIESSGPDSSDLRANILALCTLYLPCTRGDAHYLEIAKDYGNVGTTCGYLPSFVLYRMGCRDARICNRIAPDIPANTATNTIGQNIAKLVQGGKALGCYHSYLAGVSVPSPGDIVYFGAVSATGGVSAEHVAIVKSFPQDGNGTLTTYDMGHSLQPEGSLSSRVIANGNVNFAGTIRRLIGFVDISAVPVTAAPDWTDHTALVA
jgi:hypothetical protein